MFSAHHARLAGSALAATILLSAGASAQPLAMNDPANFFAAFPAPIFQQVVREPAPQAYYPAQNYPSQSQSYASRSYPQAEPEYSAVERPGVSEERFRRQTVNYNTSEAPGTIVIDTPNTFLYLVLGNGRALRYGIGVGREGFTWAGTQTVARKQEWPDWHPPEEMIARQPYLPRFMAGGPGNPLGARALYLGNTQYRIHGTNAPDTIGQRVSSGCIRLTNENIADLYDRVSVGAKVVVLPMNGARPDVAQTYRPAPAPVRQRISASYTSEAPRPAAAVPAPRPSLAYGSSASRLY